MAFLSEIINGAIPEEFAKEASLCCMCGEDIKKGGMWAMNNAHMGICKKCAPSLLDWYIDTMLDIGIIDENNDNESIKKLSNDIVDRYYRKKRKKEQHNKKHI